MTGKRRLFVLSVVACAFMLCYMDRMVMASAIPFISREFDLSALSMGEVLSAFFASYAIMQIPGGFLADRFGPRRVLIGSIAWFSVMTALTGCAEGLSSMLMIRVLFGMGEGPFPAGAWKSIANWFPTCEAGRASGILQAASYLGAVVAPLFVSVVIVRWGWRVVFYMLVVPGFVLAFLVWIMLRDAPNKRSLGGPAEHPSISETVRTCVRSPALAWCALTFFLGNAVAWGLMNWLPTYLTSARGFAIDKMSAFTALTNLAGMAGFVVGGYVCDRYFARNLRVPIVLGFVLSAGFTYLAAMASSGERAVFWLVLVFLTANIAFTGIFMLPLLIVPRRAVGAAFGVINTAGQIAGVLAPVTVGAILQFNGSDFRVVLYCMVGLALLAAYPASRIRLADEKQAAA